MFPSLFHPRLWPDEVLSSLSESDLLAPISPSIASAWRADWQSNRVWVASESPIDWVCWAGGGVKFAVLLLGGVLVSTGPRMSFFILMAAETFMGDPSNAGVRSAFNSAPAIGKIFSHWRMVAPWAVSKFVFAVIIVARAMAESAYSLFLALFPFPLASLAATSVPSSFSPLFLFIGFVTGGFSSLDACASSASAVSAFASEAFALSSCCPLFSVSGVVLCASTKCWRATFVWG